MKNNSIKTVLLSLLVMALWGSLYSFIKIGYSAFQIDTTDIPSIMLFAGLRFIVCGVILIAVCFAKDKKLELPKKNNLLWVIWGAVISIILHYGFTYIALSLGEGSKSAIIKQVGFLFLSCFAFIFDKTDGFSPRKHRNGHRWLGRDIWTRRRASHTRICLFRDRYRGLQARNADNFSRQICCLYAIDRWYISCRSWFDIGRQADARRRCCRSGFDLHLYRVYCCVCSLEFASEKLQHVHAVGHQICRAAVCLPFWGAPVKGKYLQMAVSGGTYPDFRRHCDKQ